MKYKDQIVREIEKEIVSRYYYINGKVQYSLRNDPELEKAMDILSDMDQYNGILSGNG